jgi:beta-fructofuranosidase
MIDRRGLPVLWGWIPETRSDAELVVAGWAGVMSLPRIVSLTPEGELQTTVSSATRTLRGNHKSIDPNQNPASRLKALDNLSMNDLAAELGLELLPKSDAFTLRLRSNEGSVFAAIGYSVNGQKRQLRINDIAAPLAGPPGSPVRLHMFLDGSVLELFSGATALTARLYKNPSPRLRLVLEGDVEITSLNIWQLTPISKDRLTVSLCG